MRAFCSEQILLTFFKYICEYCISKPDFIPHVQVLWEAHLTELLDVGHASLCMLCFTAMMAAYWGEGLCWQSTF